MKTMALDLRFGLRLNVGTSVCCERRGKSEGVRERKKEKGTRNESDGRAIGFANVRKKVDWVKEKVSA